MTQSSLEIAQKIATAFFHLNRMLVNGTKQDFPAILALFTLASNVNLIQNLTLNSLKSKNTKHMLDEYHTSSIVHGCSTIDDVN